MTTTSFNDSSRHDELPQPYRLAVQTILDEPMPPVDLTRLLPPRVTRNVPDHSRRRFITRVCSISIAGAAAILLVASFFALRPADAWAQVVQAVRKQSWVRLHATAPDKSAQVEMWISPSKRIGAASFPDGAFFLELDQHTWRRYDQKANTIYIAEPDPADLDEFASLDAVLDAFANKQDHQQSKVKGVKLVAEASKKGGEGDARWTDYFLDYEDSRRIPPKFRRVFRVPDGAELPTTMTEEWSMDGKTTSRSYSMEYPADGPADLYALNVPKDAKVVDSRSGEELKKLLAAYASEQKSEFDAYSATILTTVEDWKSINDAYRVRRDASGHTAEVVDFEQLFKFKFDRYQAEGRIVPEDVDRVEWWQAEVGKFTFKQFGQSDTFSPGQTFCPDLVGYPGLGIPNDGMRATLNPKPLIGPADSVMVTVEDTKSGETVGRYWLAPDRGFMCVRSEMPDEETGWIATTIVDTAEKSPKGRWYATQVRAGRVERSGEDLRPDAGVAPIATQVFRYRIKFE